MEDEKKENNRIQSNRVPFTFRKSWSSLIVDQSAETLQGHTFVKFNQPLILELPCPLLRDTKTPNISRSQASDQFAKPNTCDVSLTYLKKMKKKYKNSICNSSNLSVENPQLPSHL